MRQHTVPTPYMVGDTHFYTTELVGELVLFDTGPATPQALVHLCRQVDLSRLRHVFITHCHVDHYGLTDFLARNTAAEIYLPRQDVLKIRHHEHRLEKIDSLLRGFGFEQNFVDAVRTTVRGKGIFPTFPERYQIVEESEVTPRLGITWLACPGHSQSDLVYRFGTHAITGDILLRDIFQAPLLDIDLATFAERFRNYAAYCASLVKLQQIRDCQLHPGHRGTTGTLAETILFYVGKLLERAVRVREFNGMEPAAVLPALFGDTLVDPFVGYIKLSEIIFIRDFLAAPEILQEALVEIGLFDAVSLRYAAALGQASTPPGETL
jgi:2,4-dienoyl-CoA reductase (NADPH2)